MIGFAVHVWYRRGMSTDANPEDGCVLTLYVAGPSPRTDVAVANLHRLRACCRRPHCEIVIIDVTEHPELAEAAHILATPTLVRWSPPPARRIIGDFCNPYRVLDELRIWPAR